MQILNTSKEAQERFGNFLKGGVLDTPLRAPKPIEPVKPTTFGGTIKKAVDWIPGGKMAEGVGYALSTKYINNLEQDYIKTGNELQSKLMTQIQENKKTGKDSTRLIEISKSMGMSPVISEESLKDAPTTTQIVASAVDASALMFLGYKPALTSAGKIGITPMTKQSVKAVTSLQREINAINKAAQLRNATGLTKVALKAGQVVTPTIQSGATSAGFMALTELYMNRDATIRDVISSAVLGAGIGMAIPIGSAVVGQTSKFVGRNINTAYKATTRPIINKLREVAAGNYQVLDITKNPKDILKTIDGYNRSLKEKMAKSVVDFVDNTGEFQRKWLDSNTPFKTIQNRLEKLRGTALTDEEKLYYQIGTTESIGLHRGDKAVKELENLLKPFKKIEAEVKSALLYSDYMDRGKLGMKTPGGKTLAENIAGFKKLMDDLPIETRKQVGEAMGVVNKYVNNFIDKRVSEGLISSDLASTLRALHPNYVPHKVVLDEIGDNLMRYTRNSMNVSDSTIKRAIGSIRKIEDPIKALKEMAYLVESTAAKNKFLNNFVNVQKKYNIIDGMRPIETADNIIARLDAIKRMQELKPVRNFITRAAKAGKKEYSKIASQARDMMKKADSLLEEAAIKNLDDAIKNKEIKTLLTKYESTVKKFNETLVKADYTGSAVSTLNDISKKFSAQVSELIDIVASNRKAAKELGEQTINLFNKGKMETWVVPEDIAKTIKGLDGEQLPKWAKLLTWPQKKFKEFVTTKNISFAVKNKARDEQTAWAIGNSLIEELSKKYGWSPKQFNMTNKQLMELYRESGGYGASIFTDANRATMQRFDETGIAKFRKNFDPLELIAEFNERVEIDTRLKVFQRALEKGASPIDAAYISRNATIDFSKMGTMMRPINQMIPFLNARVQGFTNIARAVKNNPDTIIRQISNTTIYPALVLQKHNMSFDSYKDISQDIKNRNWIIMYGEKEAFVDGQIKKIPQMFTLPKGEAQQILLGPLQYMLDRQADIDKRGVREMLLDTVGEISPVHSANPFSSGFYSQFGVLSAGMGLATNKNLFYNSPILYESDREKSKSLQFRSTTPNVIRDLTKQVNEIIYGKDTTKGFAPADVEFAIQSLGGVPQDILFLTSQIYDKSNNLDASKTSLTNSAFGQLSQYPILRGFMREDRMTRSSAVEKETEIKDEAKAREADISFMKSDIIASYIKKMQKMDSDEEIKEYLNFLAVEGEINKEDLKDIATKIISQRTIGTIRKSDSNEVKASVAAYRMSSMESDEEKKKYLIELAEAGIIDAKTVQEIQKTIAGPGVLAIVRDIQAMESQEQKKQYLIDLAERGAIDKKSLEQIQIILRYDK